MRECRTYGSVRGALSNERPYRDRLHLPVHLAPQLPGALVPAAAVAVEHQRHQDHAEHAGEDDPEHVGDPAARLRCTFSKPPMIQMTSRTRTMKPRHAAEKPTSLRMTPSLRC